MPLDTTTLYVSQAAGLDLTAAAAAVTWGEGPVTALLYAPAGCWLARWADGRFDLPPGVDSGLLAGVWEARAFSTAGELRWYSTPGAGSRAVWLSEHEGVPTGFAADSPLTVEPHEHQYVLWGETDASDVPGWQALTTAQLGTLWAPLESASGQIALKAVEYWQEFAHGNVAVAEERLVGLAALPGRDARGEV